MFLQVAISAKEVKKLRDATGAGMMDCKKALVEFGGDVEAAMEELRKKGLASADKKASRAAKEGIIETYIHTGAKLGVMVEVNCETDFVAKRPEFQELAKAVAMQIAASPTVEVVSEADIDADFVEKEKKIESQSEDLQGKPDAIVAKIVEGRVAKLIKTKLLLEQPYIRDPNMNVDELVKSYVGRLGENIKVARFVRFNVGEGEQASHTRTLQLVSRGASCTRANGTGANGTGARMHPHATAFSPCSRCPRSAAPPSSLNASRSVPLLLFAVQATPARRRRSRCAACDIYSALLAHGVRR